jgi:formamidopyrimidine-DNA glycosylase
MPELPEVETIVRGLRRVLPGSTFTGVRVGWERMVQGSPLDVVRELPGQRIETVNRRGKYLVFSLATGNHLLIHLKMAGRLYMCTTGEPADPYDRVTFMLSGCRELRFRDPRKFGRVCLTGDIDAQLGHLGPEPLEDSFSDTEFLARFNGRRGVIKLLLLDQTFIAGVGNIYADEALFRARIRPLRRVGMLCEDERRRLHGAVRDVLMAAIRDGGADLGDAVYPAGEFQNSFCVHRREGQPCLQCGTAIERIKIGQRSAYFCPRCQS